MATQSEESEITDGDCPVLPPEYHDVPLDALNGSTRRKLSLFLNLEGHLNDDVGVMSNYEGLAEMVGFSYREISNFGLEKNKATEMLLQEWSEQPDLSPSVGALWGYLREMERFDVLNDAWEYIKRDCVKYLARKAHFKTSRPTSGPVQDNTVESTNQAEERIAVPDVTEGARTLFHAFVCYNPEGADLEFVKLLIEKLEDENNLKLFVPWRDDLPGTSHNTVCAQLIEQRCRRVIIILSPRFLASSSCDFQIKFAQHLSPGARDKKLIPILVERCSIPEILRFVTLCDFTKKDLLPWFWKRLISSLNCPLAAEDFKSEGSQSLRSISLDTSMSVTDWSSSSSSMSSMNSSSSSSSLPYSSGSSSYSSQGSSQYSSSYPSASLSCGQTFATSSCDSYHTSPLVVRPKAEYDQIGNVKKGISSSNTSPLKGKVPFLSRFGIGSPRTQKKNTADKKRKESPKKEKEEDNWIVYNREGNSLVPEVGTSTPSNSRVVIRENSDARQLNDTCMQQRRPVPPIPLEGNKQSGSQQVQSNTRSQGNVHTGSQEASRGESDGQQQDDGQREMFC